MKVRVAILTPKRQHRNTQSSCEPSYQLHRRQDTLIGASNSCGLLGFFLKEGWVYHLSLKSLITQNLQTTNHRNTKNRLVTSVATARIFNSYQLTWPWHCFTLFDTGLLQYFKLKLTFRYPSHRIHSFHLEKHATSLAKLYAKSHDACQVFASSLS